MKIVGITVVSLASALIFAATLDTADNNKYGVLTLNKTASESVTSLGFTYQWDNKKNSFDTALWQAIGEISANESVIPKSVSHFGITLQHAEPSWNDIRISFDRAGLELLISGAIAPEIFIREYVEFN